MHPDVKRIVICDIEPLVPTVVTPMFGTENYHVVDGIARENPHTVNGKQVEVDLRRRPALPPHHQGEVRHHHLRPDRPVGQGLRRAQHGGILPDVPRSPESGRRVCLWIPLYESNLDSTKSVIATFFKVFPNGILWSNEREGHGLRRRAVRPGRADGDRR